MTPYPRLDIANIVSLLEARFAQTFLTLRDLPSPNAFKDMTRAVARLAQAIARAERIVLVGDYDVDGVMATAIVVRFFEAIDFPIEAVIPNRFDDGYGLSSVGGARRSHSGEDILFARDNEAVWSR
jgi:single-stranded-DNA-specific exonuclease